MARGEIKRGGNYLRPTFNFENGTKDGIHTYESITAQLTESIRNILEGIAESQMLSCDTRGDIRRTLEAVEKLVRVAQAKRRKAKPKTRKAKR